MRLTNLSAERLRNWASAIGTLAWSDLVLGDGFEVISLRREARQFDADGWFDTGDRATGDADGFIRITGRSKDLIIRGGENVPVKEIEDVLIRHPGVRNVALVAVPHPRLGEIGCACVVPDGSSRLSLGALCEFLDEHRVTRQFWPEQLLVLDALPQTPSGKVQKFRLREMAAAASH